MSPDRAVPRGGGPVPLAHPCRLHAAAGRAEECPAESCAFWEPGGVVLDGRCAFEQLDMSGRTDLARLLLEVRETLESASTREEEQEARSRYHRLLAESASGK